MNTYNADLMDAYRQFHTIHYFSEEQLDVIKYNILLYGNVTPEFLRLERYFRNTDWVMAGRSLVTLNASITEAYDSIDGIEAIIDDQVAAINAQTARNANVAVWLIIGLNGAALLIGLGLAFGLAGMIATPLRKLTRAANDIGEGEVEAAIPTIKSKDEVHDLANALETMRGAIRFLKQHG